MLTANNLSKSFGDKNLFESVNLKFQPGNCYGIIGANGVGKSTFLKILSGVEESTSGSVILDKNQRLSTLSQNHFAYNDYSIIETVMMGFEELYDIKKQKDKLYSKADFDEADGILAAELEEKFAMLNGWESEGEIEKLLNGLSLEEKDYSKLVKALSDKDIVKVLLAKALFGNPNILILDEPTNHLDFKAIQWLENFIMDFDQTVIIVSHDRHFLNNVCTHIVDIDYHSANLFVGNYDFWRESSILAKELKEAANTKQEEKKKQLEEFIARFSANASKSSQATSRKKQLDKITIDEIKPSSRKYPFISFDFESNVGKDLVTVENLSKKKDGKLLFNDINFSISGHEKVVFLAENENAVSEMLNILAGKSEPDKGTIQFGKTIEKAYLSKDVETEFQEINNNLIEWLREYSLDDQSDVYMRSFLGKMLFSGDEPLKKLKVLSGGEKIRMMFAKLMLEQKNTLIMDQPTNHLDLESIQSLNEGLMKFKGNLFFSSHDFSFIESIATTIITLTTKGAVVYNGNFNDFLDNEKVQHKIKKLA